MSSRQNTSIPFLLAGAFLGVAAAADTGTTNWWQWRGPYQGHSLAGPALPLEWSESSNIVWRVNLPGDGWSSPVIKDGLVWMTTALDQGRKLEALGVDLGTGRLVHEIAVFELPISPEKHPANSYASPTPAIDGNRVYVAFGTHGVACLATGTGKVLWRNQELHVDHDLNGPGSSPVVAGEVVVLNYDGADERFVAAFNKYTGRIQWQTQRSNPINKAKGFRKAHSTPVLATFHGVPQIVSGGSYRLHSYDPLTGNELWHQDLPGYCMVPTPLVQGDMVYACTGFDRAQLWAIRVPSASGKPEVVWKLNKAIPLVPTPVCEKGMLFVVSDAGIASCVDASTGEVYWNERIGGTHWASPLAADGRIYFFDGERITTVVVAGKKFQRLAVNSLEEGVKASPAIADGALILRTTEHLYRIQRQ